MIYYDKKDNESIIYEISDLSRGKFRHLAHFIVLFYIIQSCFLRQQPTDAHLHLRMTGKYMIDELFQLGPQFLALCIIYRLRGCLFRQVSKHLVVDFIT